MAGNDDCACGPVPVGEFRLWHRRLQPDDVGDTELGRELHQRVRAVQAGSAGPADHRDDQAVTQRRFTCQQVRSGVQQHVGRLQRLDTPHEEQQQRVRRNTDAAARRRGVPGTEHLQVDTGRHHVDQVGVGVVEIDQMAPFVLGGCDQSVRAVDDSLLARDAMWWIRAVAVGERAVLHLRQGVGGVYQWDSPPARDREPNLAGKPIVRVDDVEPAGFVCGLDPKHGRGEGTQPGRKILPADVFERPGCDMAHRDSRRERDRRMHLAAGGPGEDLHFGAEQGQLPRQLHHIHVHAAGIAGARLFQRRRVHRQHGDPTGGAQPDPTHRPPPHRPGLTDHRTARFCEQPIRGLHARTHPAAPASPPPARGGRDRGPSPDVSIWVCRPCCADITVGPSWSLSQRAPGFILPAGEAVRQLHDR